MSTRPSILYAFHETGCSVCEAQMPSITEWANARVATVAYCPVNLALSPWRPPGVRDVKATPTFVVMKGENELGFHEGAFRSESEFEKFISKAVGK